MDQLERSQDIYEAVPGYAPAPQPPLPAPGDFSTLEAMGLTLTPFARRVIGAAMKVTGFDKFWPALPEQIDALQRRINLRGPALYAQAVSATLALADDARPLTPFQRASALAVAVRQLHDEYFSGQLPPDTVRGQAAEMGQYANLFSTSVIWDGGRPRLYKSKVVDKIAVLVCGRFFIVDFPATASADDLAATLESCAALAEEAESDGAERTVATITAASDQTQYKLMPVISQRPANAESLEALKHTLVTICLDLNDHPADDAAASLIAHRDNPHNRWWYASLQLVVFGNAKACALCSFSAYLDGNVMMRGAAEIVRRGCSASVGATETRAKVLPARELHWAVGQPALDMADADRLRLRDEQPVATYEFPGLGQRYFDAAKVDAVPAFVLALALATKRFTQAVPLVTQFLTMSRYRYTDLVTAMVTTPEVAAFVDAADGARLRPAIDAQKAVMSAARKSISLQTIFRLFINSDPSKRTMRGMTKRAATGFLRRTGAFKPKAREIVISHPAIYPEIPIVGRPGARLPYTKYFGLHYQIWEDKTVVTFMPGVKWQVKNEELAEELRKGLERVGELARAA